MIKLEVRQICSGPAGGKAATVVFKDTVELGFIQCVSVDNPIQGGPCFPYLHICVRTHPCWDMKLCKCFEEAMNFLGICYPETNEIEYPSGIYKEFAEGYSVEHKSSLKWYSK